MSLIKCPECGQQVSDRAKKCPHCGYVLSIPCNAQNGKPKKKNYWIWLVCSILMITVVGVGIFFYSTKRSVSTPNISETTTTESKDELVEITPEFSEKISKYLQIGEFSDGRAAVMTDGYKWGFINTKGDLVIPAIYSDWPDSPKFSNGLAFVKNEQGKSYIDPEGKVVIELAKDDIASNFADDRAVVYSAHENEDYSFTISKNFRVINKKGETITEFPIPAGANLIWDGIGEYVAEPVKVNERGFILQVDYKYFLYDFQGNKLEQVNEVDPSKYEYIVFDEARGVAENIVILRGIKDKQGNVVVPAKEWHFHNVVYDTETQKNYVNQSHGLFLVRLEESPYYLKNVDNKRYMDESSEASYFGFVNLKGEDTFSPERWERQKIQSYNEQNRITAY